MRLLSIFDGFQRRYLRQVATEHRIFNTRGLRSTGSFTLQLEKVFVELRIAPGSTLGSSYDPISRRELAGSLPIWDFLRQTIAQDAQALAIIGAPGSGKTTLLQNIALTLALDRQGQHGLPPYVPLLLFLRDHTEAITGKRPPALGQLAQDIFTVRREEYPEPPPGWFERQLRKGRCMVLLDGLDEVAVPLQRRRMAEWVDRQIVAYPAARFLLTSRPRGYADARLQRAHRLDVQPLSTEQVGRFIHNFNLANEIMGFGGREDEGVRRRAHRDAELLIERLRRRPALGELTRNPLLLTMIVTVHRFRGELPARRIELYAEICDVLLGHWQAAKGLTGALTAAQIRAVLQPLAAHLMDQQRRDLRTAEALGVLREPLAQVGISATDAASFLPDIQARCGMLQERESDLWSFLHHTFQEYLAALHLRETGVLLPLPELLAESWWHETLRLYAALGDATALVRACLDAGGLADLGLASDCLDEARTIEPAVRALAEERLIAALEAEDPARWRLAAEVQLATRLRGLQPMDDQREIDTGYVSCAEYQLFLEEMRAQGRFHQPDHWREVRFPPGQARAPVTGVRAADAEAFCVWLSQRLGGGARIRLPTPEEVAAHPQEETRRAKEVAAWCSRPGQPPCLAGLAEDSARSLLTRSASLIEVSATPVLEVDLDGPFDAKLVSELGLARDVERARSRDFSHIAGLDLEHLRARAGCRALARCLDMMALSTASLARTRSLGVVRDVCSTLGRGLDLWRALSLHGGASSLGEQAATAARLLTRIMESLPQSPDHADANLDRAQATALSRAVETARGTVRELAQEADRGGRGVDATRVPDLLEARSLARGEAGVLMALEHGEFQQARLLAEQISSPPASRLLVDRLDTLLAETQVELRRAARFYIAHRATAARDAPVEKPLELERILFSSVVALAREEGALPAWEGIRLVREVSRT